MITATWGLQMNGDKVNVESQNVFDQIWVVSIGGLQNGVQGSTLTIGSSRILVLVCVELWFCLC